MSVPYTNGTAGNHHLLLHSILYGIQLGETVQYRSAINIASCQGINVEAFRMPLIILQLMPLPCVIVGPLSVQRLQWMSVSYSYRLKSVPLL